MGLFSTYKLLDENQTRLNSSTNSYRWVQIKKTGEYALLDEKTKQLGEGRYSKFDKIPFSDFWLVSASKNGPIAIMDNNGIVRTGYVFGSLIEPTSMDKYYIAFMIDGSGATLVKKDNFEILDRRFEKIGQLHNGLRTVTTKDGETYFKEATGKLMRCRFSKVYDFSYGMGMVQTLKGYTYVNDNAETLPVRFSKAKPFEADGCAIVGEENYWTLVNKNGIVTEGKFSAISAPEGLKRICYVKDKSHKVVAENGYISAAEWFKLVDKDGEMFEYLPYQRFRDSSFVKRCKEIVVGKLYKKAGKDLSEEDLNKTQAILEMIENKEISAAEEIRQEDVQTAEEAMKKAATEQAKLQKKTDAKKAAALAEERRKAEEEEKKRQAEEERRRLAEEQAQKEKAERERQLSLREKMAQMLKDTHKDKAE